MGNSILKLLKGCPPEGLAWYSHSLAFGIDKMGQRSHSESRPPHQEGWIKPETSNGNNSWVPKQEEMTKSSTGRL